VDSPIEPEARLTIQYEGKPRELFMSFLRLNALLRLIEDPTHAVRVMLDPDLSEDTLKTLLSPSIRNGEHFTFDLDDTLISNEDCERVLDWAQDHLLYFFTKRFQQIGQKAKDLEPLAQALLSLAPGSSPSTSETTSAGPLELSPAA
jgi:hypothetical protein